MKILFLLHSTLMGGATISAKNLIFRLKEKGVEVVVALPKKSPHGYEIEREFVLNGIKCKRFTERDSIYQYTFIGWCKFPLRRLLNFISLLEIIAIVRHENITAIHTNTGVLHEGFYAAKILKLPHFWHLREYQTIDFNMRIFPSFNGFKKILKKSNTICITKDIQSYFGLSKCENSYVVYNPVYSVDEIPALNYDKEKYFFIANRISKEKGVHCIIESFAEIVKKHPDYKLLIAGLCTDGKYLKSLKLQCKELGIENKIEFLGYITSAKDYIKNAEALFVGSMNEGFGRMTAEANMVGCPVIGRNSAGTKEIIGITGGGFLFNEDSQICNCAEQLFNMKNRSIETWKEWIKGFQQKAISSFSSEVSVMKILDIYTKVQIKNIDNDVEHEGGVNI